MNRFVNLALGLSLALFALPLHSQNKLNVELKDAKGNSVGSAVIADQAKGVVLDLHLHGLPPGEHAIHFHQSAHCDLPDFQTAGGHNNPDSKKHGFDNPQGHHAGDMTNFKVGDDGKAEVKLEDKDVTVSPGPHSLLNFGGSSVIIHAKPDDYKTDPSGNSGDRIACGVIVFMH
jgi:superoxide dismutase, Cu-Zn family